MKREGRNHGMAIKFSPGGEFRHARGKLLLCGDGAASSAPRKSSPRSSSKSKDKGKGSNKAKGLDIRLNPQLASWKIMVPSGDPLWKRLSFREFEDEEEEEEPMEVAEEREVEEDGKFGEEEGGGGEDDVMDFYEVWGTWEYVDEEDWCVVGEDM